MLVLLGTISNNSAEDKAVFKEVKSRNFQKINKKEPKLFEETNNLAGQKIF